MITTDVLIIGAGPVGLFTIFECGMLKMNCHVVDSLDFIGGQCSALYPEKPIYDIPGFPEIEAQKLIHNLEKQAVPFNPHYHFGQQVTEVRKEGEYFISTTSKGVVIKSKVIIIAAGCGAFGPNRPPLENLSEYEKNGGVAYLVRSKEDYRGKKIAIAGGGDSAVDWAIILAEVSEKLYFIHRRDKFRAAPESVSKMKKLEEQGKIEMVIPYQLSKLKGEKYVLNNLELTDLDGGIKNLEIDTLLCFFGLAMELGPIATWGLSLDKTHILVDQSTSETNIKGIFAAGDISTYKGKLKLITCGFSEAAIAAHNAYNYVHSKPLHFEYSTSKGVPNS
jgi:thioredoxin reductase (NADPH)